MFLDLDVKCGLIKLEAGCIIFHVVHPVFIEETPFYCEFRRGGTILSGKFGRRLVKFLSFSMAMVFHL